MLKKAAVNRHRWQLVILCTIAALSLLSCSHVYLQYLQFTENDEYDEYNENYEKTQVLPAAAAADGDGSIPHDYTSALREFITVEAAATQSNRTPAKLWEFYHYNVLRSNQIGVCRTLPDTRDSSCNARPLHANIHQQQHLRVSVIITFHNEARSTLLRTIMSLYYRTPTIYLHELILIDDCSQDAYLLSALLRLKHPPFSMHSFSTTSAKSSKSHAAKNTTTHTGGHQQTPPPPPPPLPPPHYVTIKTARNAQRSGVIASRNRGARLATGDYLLFLDSHCEVNVGWLEPLLERVAGAHAAGDVSADLVAVSPALDGIDDKSLKYVATSKNLMGGFDWNLHFHWISRAQSIIPQSQAKQQEAAAQQSGQQKQKQQQQEKQQQKQQQQQNRPKQQVLPNQKSPYKRRQHDWKRNESLSVAKIERDPNFNAKPFKSPTFSGGIFMISRKGFFKLNGFNPSLQTWGGESIESSIKLWLCGGRIEIVPCSRIGHIFRKEHPFSFPKDGNSRTTYLRNSKIIAESWLDVYKYFFYASKPAARHININNSEIRQIHQLRSALKCHSFAWYLQHVFPQLKLPNDDFIAFGTLSSGELCLQITHHAIGVDHVNQRLHMSSCYRSDVTHWYLHRHNSQLQANPNVCLNVVKTDEGEDEVEKGEAEGNGEVTGRPPRSSIHYATHFRVVLQHCNDVGKSLDRQNASENWRVENEYVQHWLRRGGWLVHHQTQLCLDNPLSDVVAVSHCRNAAPSQLFRFTTELQRL